MESWNYVEIFLKNQQRRAYFYTLNKCNEASEKFLKVIKNTQHALNNNINWIQIVFLIENKIDKIVSIGFTDRGRLCTYLLFDSSEINDKNEFSYPEKRTENKMYLLSFHYRFVLVNISLRASKNPPYIRVYCYTIAPPSHPIPLIVDNSRVWIISTR